VNIKKTVVYEVCEQGTIFIFRSDGSCRLEKTPGSLASIEELSDPETIHVYDAKALSKSEPTKSRAFLIEFTSRNQNNYAQTIRRTGIALYCIPSYTEEELKKYNDIFHVSLDDVRKRCSLYTIYSC
jgi:hypothetical protein